VDVKIEVCGVPVDSVTRAEVVTRVLDHCGRRAGKPLTIFSCNVDMLVKAERDAAFASTLGGADILLPDGMPVVWLGRALGGAFPERVTGADLLQDIATACAQTPYSIFLLGAAPGVAEEAAGRLVARNPGLRVAGTLAPEPGFDGDPEALEAIFDHVRAADPDVLFIALGAPRQERFTELYGHRLTARVILPVGAAIDMAAGRVKRAPVAVQRAGGEWLWRLVQEPRRLSRRYLREDPKFFSMAARALWKKRRAS
jgi:N-acetylglucosaminyldiphosphoundecaprenol N-acetyl-beta-D-mannosaminyltransferase